jgi:hypothetical protein
MKMTKQTMVPALLLGLTLVGAGSVALADFTAGQLPAAVLSKFTDTEQSAITQAQTIRAKADVEAKAVLAAAGVTEVELHTAMDSYRDTERKAMDTAFTALIANSPDASMMTPEIFAKLVKAYSLEAAGDHAGAMTLRQELRDAGFKGMGMGMMGGRGMGEGRGHGPRAGDSTATTESSTTTTN